MSTTTQVEYETSNRVRYGIVFLAAALLVVGGQLLQLIGPQAPNSEVTSQLLTIHKRVATDLIGAVLISGGFIALAYSVVWVHDITRARNPAYQNFIRWVLWAGAVLSGVTAIINEIFLASAASTFAKSQYLSYPEAKHALSGPALGVLQILGYLGAILLPVGLIWIVLNAMRVGLLPKPLAYVGVAAGAMFLLPIFGPIGLLVQAGWLAAMAILVGGRWPSGDPPAWPQGVAVPWPSAAELAAGRQQVRQRQRAAVRGSAPAPAPAVVEASPIDAAESGRTRSTTPKRKRKKR